MTAFLDTNVIIYAQDHGAHGDKARKLILAGGVISVQVLNEFVSVLRRKFRRDWDQIEAAVADVVTALGPARGLSMQTHKAAFELAREHNFNFYDALIVAAALEAGCSTIYSEDMQHDRRIGSLTIRNPFV